MREDQLTRIAAALKKGYDLLAGDNVTLVKSSGAEHDLLAIMYDLETEGLVVDSTGIRNDGIRELLFLKHYLAVENVDIEPTDHWVIEDERWDFVPQDPIMTAIVPLGGLHNMLMCWVTKAVEVNETQPAAQWGWSAT